MRVTDELMAAHQHLIDELTLVPGRGGVFDVEADGTVIYSKRSTGRHAVDGEVLAAFEELLPPGTLRYEG